MPTSSQMSDQTMWLIVGAVGLLGLYLLLRQRKGKGEAYRVPTFPPQRQRQVEEQMNQLLVELSNMARQITGQLDTRAAKLELLIQEADERLAELRALKSIQPTRDAPDAPTPAAATPAPPTETRAVSSNSEAHAEEAETLAREPESAAVPAAQPPVPEAGRPRPVKPSRTIDPRHAEVYALADEGRSTAEIARLLTRPAGEVELILALRRS